MLCALTVRKLKPGTYEDFRKAWEEDVWPKGWLRAYVTRKLDDPNEVVTFGFFDGTLEELRRTQREADYTGMRARTDHFVESVGADGIYEVLEELEPPGQ